MEIFPQQVHLRVEAAEVIREQPSSECVVRGERVTEAEFDALWFARPSHEGREVWELRLWAAHPYALFAAFESDETEEEREEARLEMEHQMRDQVGSVPPAVAGG